MRTMLACGVAFAALMIPAAAFAQSTATIEAENPEIVVSGQRGTPNVNGIQTPDTPKAKAVLTQELIERRTPGQTILDTINLVPGVSFTNSDPYGGSGGQLRIRGFSGDRVSLTFDGIPLNDSGNYSIYSNQQLDPELIQEVNVNFGATDVDSPTASASGGTVNYRSLTPTDKISAAGAFSHGTNDMNRAFVLLNTGTFTSFGTKAWLSASTQTYDQFRGYGKINKQQFNGKIYQPIGSGRDFISIAAHYNQNRNSSYSNPTIANIRTRLAAGGTTIPAATAITAANPYTLDLSNAQYDYVFDDTSPTYLYDRSCNLASAAGVRGTVQNDRNSCNNVAGTAINPSNTGNVRVNSRFGITDKLTFTFDGAYSFTRANGGGSTLMAESNASATNANGTYAQQFQRVGAGIAAGADLNGDGDQLDFVRVYWPSNTRTQRFTAIANLRYEFDSHNAVRLAYTWDRARHRQTGEASLLDPFGRPYEVFSALDGEGPYAVNDAAGNILNKRNRLSYAILHQVSGEYRGTFFEDKLDLTLGVRAPFFRRNLSNYCYTIPGNSSDAYCTSQTAAQVGATPATAAFGLPYKNRIKAYDAVLPNVGFTYNIFDHLGMFGSYAKGVSVPKTDNLYSFDDVKIAPVAEVQPEKTDSFDLGLRYSSRIIQAQVAAWYISYKNRIISSTVQLEGGGTQSLDRNVGKVESKGVDASLGIQPTKHISLYGFVSYLDSELKNDATDPISGAIIVATKGKFVVETPEWQYGGRAQVSFEPVSVGVQVKRTGSRWVTDVNDLKAAGYTIVDLDARFDMKRFGLDNTFFQLNVSNLLNERYFGNLSTNTIAANNPRFTFGAPRTFIGSVHFGF
jgi:iron complex outermembrane receptor protein